ncbi:MAG: hypothetical protein AB7T38_12260 [Nitrospirales bacterium]
MKKTLFIINDQGQESKELPTFYSKLAGREQGHFLLLHLSDPAKWSFIPSFMVLENSSKNTFPPNETNMEQVTYQNFLEKIFEVEVALVI